MEMDAYLAAKLGTAAITNSKADTTALTSANILAKWDEYLAALADADEMLFRLGKLFNYAPGLVLAAVIDEKDAAVLTDLAGGAEALDLFKEHRGGNG